MASTTPVDYTLEDQIEYMTKYRDYLIEERIAAEELGDNDNTKSIACEIYVVSCTIKSLHKIKEDEKIQHGKSVQCCKDQIDDLLLKLPIKSRVNIPVPPKVHIPKKIATIDEQIALISGVRKILEETPGAQVCYSNESAYIFREIQENLQTTKMWNNMSELHAAALQAVDMASIIEVKDGIDSIRHIVNFHVTSSEKKSLLFLAAACIKTYIQEVSNG